MSVKASGTSGSIPMGEEYWKQQAQKKEAEGETPWLKDSDNKAEWKSPEGTNYIPIIESNKIIKNIEIKKSDLEQYKKPMMDYMEIRKELESVNLAKNLLVISKSGSKVESFMKSFEASLTDENDKIAFNNAKDKLEFITQYLNDHPDYKPSISLEAPQQEADSVAVEPEASEEVQSNFVEHKKPYVAPEIEEQ